MFLDKKIEYFIAQMLTSKMSKCTICLSYFKENGFSCDLCINSICYKCFWTWFLSGNITCRIRQSKLVIPFDCTICKKKYLVEYSLSSVIPENFTIRSEIQKTKTTINDYFDRKSNIGD